MANPQYGMTAPLSLAPPTDSDNQHTNTLVDELRRQNSFESQAETDKRSVALSSLQKIAEEFVKQVTQRQGKPDHVASNAGAKILTFGSFRLGVFGPGSDIDTLLVAPANVQREDFFEHFPTLLQEMAPEGAVTDVKPVIDAFVPILKFEWNGISIDLIFARLAQFSSIPQNLNLLDNSILRGQSETDLRCVNGTRVTDAILDLVPQKSTFRMALRAIKLWAQRRAVYANIVGFPGGVAWAMLVARVCQLYPKAAAATLVLKFFRLMERWNWPQPVMLRNIENGFLPVRIWNPKIYKGDSFHLMPIITPAYPAMCATHNVTNSTKEIITRELKRGGEIADQIMRGKAPWANLFVKHTFFTQGYKYYLSIVSASTTTDAQHKWSGLVESKVRLLVGTLENHDSIHLAHPFVKGFDRIHSCKTEEEVESAKSGSLKYQVAEIPTSVSESDAVAKVEGSAVEADTKPTIVYTTTHYVGLELNEGAKSLDLSWQVDDFKFKCTSWERYDDNLNALNVCHTRNVELPDDVFGPDEIKPTRPAKKKATNGNSKRTAPDDSESTTGTQPKRQQMSTAAA